MLLRAEHGECFSADSIRNSGEKYKTRLGRTVYGGGGIVPDIFVPRDTTGITSYFKEAYLGGLLFQYAYDYVDNHRTDLAKYDNINTLSAYIDKKNIVEGFANYAAKAGLKRRNLMIQRSHKLLVTYISSAIISDILDDNEAAQFANRTDPAVNKAISVLATSNAFPLPPHKSKAQAWAAIYNVRPNTHFAWSFGKDTYFTLMRQGKRFGKGRNNPTLKHPSNKPLYALCPKKIHFVNI